MTPTLSKRAFNQLQGVCRRLNLPFSDELAYDLGTRLLDLAEVASEAQEVQLDRPDLFSEK